jgi:hypothetical protein
VSLARTGFRITCVIFYFDSRLMLAWGANRTRGFYVLPQRSPIGRRLPALIPYVRLVHFAGRKILRVVYHFVPVLRRSLRRRPLIGRPFATISNSNGPLRSAQVQTEKIH